MIIDSHQHFWQVGRFAYPWMTPELGVLYRDFLPSQLEPLLKQHGITKTVLVQASNTLAETYWLLSLADTYPFIAGVVGWVDLTDAGLERELKALTANPKFKGVRHLVESEPAEDWLAQPSVLRKPRRTLGCANQSSAGSLSTRCRTPLNFGLAVRAFNSLSSPASVRSTPPTTPAING